MTTIAYDHKAKEIAVDGRMTNGFGVINSDSAVKYFKVNGLQFFMCGCVADIQRFIEDYPNNLGIVYECNGFIIENGEVFLVEQNEQGHFLKERLMFNNAIGSGSSFALSAMDFGATAREAVKYAATRDVYTGGKIRVFKVK